MPYIFHHGDGIRHFFGVLAQMHQLFEEQVHVGKVKIPRQNQITASVIVLPQKGMAGLQAVFAMGSVAQMPQKQFAQIRQHGLHAVWVLFKILSTNPGLLEIPVNPFENILEGLGGHRPGPADVAGPRGYLQFDGRNAGAVLSPVVLLLHEEVEFLEPVIRGTVLALVVRNRFA